MFIKKQDNPQLFLTQGDRSPLPQTEGVRKKILHYSYLLTDRIGKGYSSVVYRGLNESTGGEVAIKVIELRSLRDQTSRAMLETEIECLKETRHPSLLRYEHSFKTANNCYIITEFCAGGDLARLIKERGSFGEEEAGRLFMQIFEGYQHFHAAGFIHRDLKPANILVTAEGALRIADFGFSKRRSLVQRENYNVGTPIYMPKESLTANIYNEKTDVWAMGITLFEMLFGYVPFRGKTELELRGEIEKGVIAFPDCKPISEQLKNFIGCCLHSDSFRRISIREMHKHPWILRIRKGMEPKAEAEQHYTLGKWAKTELEEKQMRISLPNEGVPHNKSKDYFQKPGGLLQNRRSISSMQKLKLCHPKKGSQMNLPASLPRQPLNNRSVAAINLTMPLHKRDQSSQKDHSKHTLSQQPSIGKDLSSCDNKQNMPSNRASVSVSTLPSMNSVNPKEASKKEQAKQDNRTKTGIEKIVSLINYFRLLYKITEKIEHASHQVLDSQIRAELSRMNNIVVADLKRNFEMHQESLASKTNLFGLNSQFWSQFIGTQRWTMYSYVIERYQLKYEPTINTAQDRIDGGCSWRRHFLDFYGRMRDLENSKVLIVKQRFILCELAYLLETLVEMDEVVLERGWEDFTEKYSSRDQIVPQGFNISMTNYYEVDQCVRNKYASLRLRH